MPVLELSNVEVGRRGKRILSGIDMTIDKGDIYLLVGESGAGKTAISGVASGQIIPDKGSVRLFGDISARQRRRLGAYVGRPPLFKKLNARDNLAIRAISLGVPDAEKSADALIEKLGLDEFAHDKVETLPAGIVSWLGLAQTLIASPDLLVLDGVLSGLDSPGRARMLSVLLRLNQEREVTVLLTSREIGGLSTVATRFGILSGGTLVCEYSAEGLSNALKSTICVMTSNTEITLVRLEETFQYCSVSLREDGVLEVSGPTLDEVSRALFSFPERIVELSERRRFADDLVRREAEGDGVDHSSRGYL